MPIIYDASCCQPMLCGYLLFTFGEYEWTTFNVTTEKHTTHMTVSNGTIDRNRAQWGLGSNSEGSGRVFQSVCPFAPTDTLTSTENPAAVEVTLFEEVQIKNCVFRQRHVFPIFFSPLTVKQQIVFAFWLSVCAASASVERKS
jgi:hypothetical protein